MAIVEGKQGMRIGNMPSIDAVTQDGFIIYSDDGIHTYKMTIAEFAQAIGVVMTGGGDGDGGGGLLYWNEESERIFRDIIEEGIFDERKMRYLVLGGAPIAYDLICAGRMTHTGVTNENGYTANFGSTSEIYLPDYTDQSGTTWTYPRATQSKYGMLTNALSTIRYPALNDSLLQPNSAYYCNVLNKDALSAKCFSQLDTKLTFEDVIINPPVKAVRMGSKDGVPGFTEEGLVTLEYDRIYAMGQDRVYFGKINLNAVHSLSPINRMGGWVEGEGWSVYSTYKDHPDGYDTREEAEADLAATSASMSAHSWGPAKNLKAGTYEYYFTLYCIGNPKTSGQTLFAKDQLHLEPTIEVGYYPWQLARDYTVMREGNMLHDTSYAGDCLYLNFSLDDEQIYYGYPEFMDGSDGIHWGHGLINPRYIDTVCYKDQNTGYIFPSPYLRFTPCFDGDGQTVIPTPEYYDDIYDGVHNPYDPYTRPDGSTLVYTTYSEALQAQVQMATYWDKADFGGAYFQDDDGTIWYIILTGATRENASPWYWAWGSTREGTSMGDIVTSIPTEFDKYPTALNITMDHWCYDGVEDHTVYDGLGYDDKIGFVPHIQEHRYTDPDTHEVTYKYSGYLTQTIVSLKEDYLKNAYHKIQNIGRAVLAELGLKGIKPLFPSDTIGIHSEISATTESALSGGYYRQGRLYEETYNLDAIEGSLYLKGDAYDNGEKVKNKYQRKLIQGDGITIEDDENGNPVISSSGGGGGGASVNVEAAYDNVYKRLDITGLNGKTIKILDGGGAHFEIVDGYDGTSGSEIRLKNSIDFLNGTNLVHGEVKPYGSSYSANAGKVELDLSSDAKGNIPKKVFGGNHVYFYGPGANQDGYTINDGDNTHQNVLYTDCIDTIKKNGVALTKTYDAQTGSYYVDIATGGGSSNPFTIDIGGNYLGSQYVDSNINSFTKLGSIYVQPNDGYCWIQVEVALQSLWSDSEAADSKFILEVRKDGYTGDIVDGNYPSNMSLRSLYFTDVRPVMHDDIVSLWTKLSVSGLVNYTGTDPVKFNVNVKQNTGNRKMVSWRAAVVYVAPPT